MGKTPPLDREWQSSGRKNGTGNTAVDIFGKANLPQLVFILILKSDLKISYNIFGAPVPGTLYLLNLILTPNSAK